MRTRVKLRRRNQRCPLLTPLLQLWEPCLLTTGAGLGRQDDHAEKDSKSRLSRSFWDDARNGTAAEKLECFQAAHSFDGPVPHQHTGAAAL